MTLAKFIRWYKPEVKGLESILIASAVKDREWEDFHHNLKDRVILMFASFFLRVY